MLKHLKTKRWTKVQNRPCICQFLVACILGLTFGTRVTAATKTTTPSKQTAPLKCSALQFSTTQVSLPALDVSAVLTLQNVSSAPIVIVQPALGFFCETTKDQWRDVSTSIYVEPDAANPWFVAPGQTAQFKFNVQLLHDTPLGRLRVRPRIRYFSRADSVFPQLTYFGQSVKGWQVKNPAKGFNATATLVKTETPPGASKAVQLAVADNRLKGRITLQSPKSTLRPNTDYVAGVFYKSDRSGWDSAINKGAAITEYDAKGAVRAQQMHLFEVPYWNWELTRFKSDAKAMQADMAVWNRGWALKQNGQSWYSSAFLVPADKLQVLETVAPEMEATVDVKKAASHDIVFLGDDRPKPGEGGDWIGRYGNESFILCGMQSPQDVVGGRLLPKRRWAKGKDGFAPTAPVWTDWKGEFFYEVLTGNPKESPRHWIPIDELTTKDPRALVNPLEGGRRYSSWDDRGEVRPFDNKGPDLIVNLEIPKGLHRLTLYFMDWDFYDTSRPRAHRLFFSDGNKDEKALLSSGYVSDFGQGVYKVYGVSGPSKLRLRIQKDKSVCAVLSGIFLDEINLPYAKRVLPPQDKQSAVLQQAAQEWEALRALQSTPEKFLASGERMKGVLRLANQAVGSGSPDEKAAAEWLRWQCTSALVVAPWVKEPSFRNYVASRPPANAAAARVRVRWLLEQGEVGLARQATQKWLQVVRKDSPTETLATLREAMVWFSQRDTNHACSLAVKFVEQAKQQKVQPEVISQTADGMMQLANMIREGTLGSRSSFRVAAVLYGGIGSDFGAKKSDDTDAFRLAQATAQSPGYFHSMEKHAVEAYQEYLQQWPYGKHAIQAHWEIVRLADVLAIPLERRARGYVSMGADSARAILEEHDKTLNARRVPLAQDMIANEKSNLNAATRMAEILLRIGDKQEAGRWYGEVTNRVPESNLFEKLIQQNLK